MLETIYTDFTTKLLPKIAEGLVMTKDYFTDLFGRYVHFLIVRDIIYLGLNILGLIITLFICYKIYKYTSKDDFEWIDSPHIVLPSMLLIIPIIFMISGIVNNTTEIVKLKYIPEVVVFEKIKSFNK